MPQDATHPQLAVDCALARDAEGVHPIANTGNPARVADIVFVHGLAGGSHSTWTYGTEGEPGHFFWPTELGRDLPEFGIWSLGYEAGVVPWFGADGMPIEDRAVNLKHKLVNHGLGQLPLVFIVHSMGGLMVKEIIVQSRTANDAEWSQLVEQVAGIVFCGTPHRGSHVAGMAKNWDAVLRTKTHIREMAAGERHLDRLHQRFVEWQQQSGAKIETYTENIGLKRHAVWARVLPAVVIVPPDSANPQMAGCRCIPCNDDHVSLVKPQCRQHNVYAGVLRFVKAAVVPPKVAAPRSDLPAGNADVRQMILQILREEGLLPLRR